LSYEELNYQHAKTIKTPDQLLINEANGYSMETHYSKGPGMRNRSGRAKETKNDEGRF
jgi:hypothetical protein